MTSSAAGSAFEPDSKWKDAMRRRIDNGVSSIAEDAKKAMQRELLEAPIAADDLSVFLTEFDAIVREVHAITNVHYTAAITCERRMRRWASSLKSKDHREAENTVESWREDQQTEVLRRVQEMAAQSLLLETVRASQSRQPSPAPRNVPPTPIQTPPRHSAQDKGKGKERQMSESPPPPPPMRSRSVSTNLTDEQRQRQQEEFARREDMIRRKREKDTARLFEQQGLIREDSNSRRSGGTPAPSDVPQSREPDEAWKAATRKQVEKQMASLVSEAKSDLEAKLHKSTTDRQRLLLSNEYNDTMRSLRMLAHEQYDEALKRERALRKYTTQQQPPGAWTEAMEREQQALFDNFDMAKEQGRGPLTPGPDERPPPRQQSYSVPPDRQMPLQMPIDIKPGGHHRRPSFATSHASTSQFDVMSGSSSSPRLSPEQEAFKLRELAIARRHEERQRRDSNGASMGRSVSRGISPAPQRPSTSVPFTDYGTSSSPRRPSGWSSTSSYSQQMTMSNRAASDAIAIAPPKLNTSQSYGSPGTSAGGTGVMDPTEWRRRQQELVRKQQAQYRA